MKIPTASLNRYSGFALIVTLSLMILLTILAVGLLSLSSISLRSASSFEVRSRAQANAKLAMLLALGELQKAAGDDRRITADGSILDGAKHPNVVGVWKSWSPKLAENPLAGIPDYKIKESPGQFVGWLTSSATPTDLQNRDWMLSGTLANETKIFTNASDGFSLSGSKVEVLKGKPAGGTFAWAVVQDATRAMVNVSGPESNSRILNDDLHVQARPSLSKSDSFNQPASGWNQRSQRVISMSQAKLDQDLWKGGTGGSESAHFTTQGLGLLTDVVNGGLKTDMSLGFEMATQEFEKKAWGPIRNPFKSSAVSKFTIPPSYQDQRPLFAPLTTSGSVKVDLAFNPASTSFEFPAAAVPTFHTLRSYYRTPYHLYNTPDGPTVFERGMDHVALKQAVGGNLSPGKTPPATFTQTGYRPVLDRLLYVFSVGLGADKEVRLIMTPIVTLWNPYNVALEVEGAVVYPWMDMPFNLRWNFSKNGTASEPVRSVAFSQILGQQFISQGHGRSVNPYFFASITPDGSGTTGSGQTLRFKPGEVRVFAPTSQTEMDLFTSDPIKKRTLPMKAVDDPNLLSARGGLAIRMKNAANGSYGFTRPMLGKDTVQLEINASTGSDYPFSVSMEDATRLKLANPGPSDRGQLISDIQTINFAKSGATTNLKTPFYSANDISDPAKRQPFGMIETYHRVANDVSSSRRSDLVFTINPRQPFINRYLTTGSFLAGPHYETRVRPISTISGVVETDNNGRTSFYGRSHSSNSGESELAFFEVPQAQPLSLAAFQNADLSGTAYSSGYQFANSWASAYLKRTATALKVPRTTGGTGEATFTRAEMPVYDYSYLANEALWDSFFLSGATPRVQPGGGSGRPSIWLSTAASVTGTTESVIGDFIDNPLANPLRNPRMKLIRGNATASDLKAELVKPEGCVKFAAYLGVEGAFNINSTSEKAWIAILSGLRDADFVVRDGTPPAAGKTAFPRFRNPIGTDSNNWLGYRSLSDPQIEDLAKKLVLQVRTRGPFLSLAEFVNRRVDSGVLGLSGAVQAAIDQTSINQGALYDQVNTAAYPADGRSNISPPHTGVAVPGFLTQADVLQSIAPVITVRSDTFTIRSYGEAKSPSGQVVKTWCEAVVQRIPDFIDPANTATATPAELTAMNQRFGRKFSIISFRYLANNEVIP